MCKHAVKRLPYLLRYVPDKYKTEQMCDEAILENGGTLKYVPDCYKNQEMCNKVVENYPYTLEYFPECYKTKEMCRRAVRRCFFVSNVIPDKYKTQEICNLAVSLYFSFMVYCPYKYLTQEMCDETGNDSLAVLELISDWFVTSKMIKKLFTALYADDNILYFNEDSGDAVVNYNEMGIVNIELNEINLDINFDEEDPNTILIRLLAWHTKSEKCKELKKELNKELMSVVCHPKRWRDWCVSEDEKIKIDLVFIEEL